MVKNNLPSLPNSNASLSLRPARQTRAAWVSAVLFSFMGMGCDNTPTLVDLERCVPDETFICECPDLQFGEATCQADRHIGACLCPAGDAGSPIPDAAVPDAGN